MHGLRRVQVVALEPCLAAVRNASRLAALPSPSRRAVFRSVQKSRLWVILRSAAGGLRTAGAPERSPEVLRQPLLRITWQQTRYKGNRVREATGMSDILEIDELC